MKFSFAELPLIEIAGVEIPLSKHSLDVEVLQVHMQLSAPHPHPFTAASQICFSIRV